MKKEDTEKNDSESEKKEGKESTKAFVRNVGIERGMERDRKEKRKR